MTFSEAHGSAQRISVDATTGVSTGISATDRSRTVRMLADPATVAADLVRPGHVIPLRAHDGGTVARAGCAEAAVDLARLAGSEPAGVLCGVVSAVDACRMAGPVELREFAADHDLELIEVAGVARHVAALSRIDRAAG
jgi:3,4-dihydroxy 2-butanone 4-phosphate synthase/GTP cyclohydrolase II